MSQAAAQSGILVRVAGDAMSARVTISAEIDPSFVCVEAVLMELRGQSIQLTKAVQAEVEALIERFADVVEGEAELVLEGTPPVPGVDGRFEWEPGRDPTEAARGPADETANVNHYERSPFVTVEPDEPIGRVVPPTAGESGLNLRGEPVPAKAGRPASVSVDARTIAVDGDGVCRALIAGVIHYKGNKLSINPQLEVNEFVDFHTGHIRFAGNVVARKGVRDRFQVSATGSVSIAQLVEAAIVEAGADLHMPGGMAAKGIGRISVGQDLHARYLANVSGLIKRDAAVDREIIQCRLGVNRNLRVERGSLIGGVTRVGGAVHLGELGSRAHLATLLVLGTLPELEQMMRQLEEHMADLRGKINAVDQELTQLCSHPNLPSDQQKRLTELMEAGPSLEARLAEAEQRQRKLVDRFELARRVDLRVDDAVHAGAAVRVDSREIVFDDSIHKPVRIAWTRQRRLVVSVGDGTLHPVEQSPFVKVQAVECRDDEDEAGAAKPKQASG